MPVLGSRGGGSNRGFGFGGLSAPNPVTSTLGAGSNEFVFEQSNSDLEVRWVDPIFTGSLPLLDVRVQLLGGPSSPSNAATTNLYSSLRPLTSSATVGGEEFGRMVAISSSYILVGAPGNDTGATDSGQAYIYNFNTGQLIHTLNHPSPFAGDNFGQTVALSDKYAIVAAYGEAWGDINQGIVYVFSTSTGERLRTIFNPNTGTRTRINDQFGISQLFPHRQMAVYGERLAVGAIFEDTAANFTAGVVHVFDLSLAGLRIVFTLENPDGAQTGDSYGKVIAMSQNYIIVGASTEDNVDADNDQAGVAYLYSAVDGTLLRTFNNPDATPTFDRFGSDVAVTENYLAISALSAEGGGAVYVYNPSNGNLLYTIANPNNDGTDTSDSFGISISMNDTYLIVGASFEQSSIGAAYVFDVTNGSLIRTIPHPNPSGVAGGDQFGTHVGLSGTRAVVAAYRETVGSYTGQGRAYIFDVRSNYRRSWYGTFVDSGTYLAVPDRNELDLETSTFCIEAFIRHDIPSDNVEPRGIVNKRGPGTNDTSFWFALVFGGATARISYAAWYPDAGGVSDSGSGVTDIPAGEWTHVAVTRVGGSDPGAVLRLFVNGKLDAVITETKPAITNTNSLKIGRIDPFNDRGRWFIGDISNVRITKGSLPPEYSTSSTTVGQQIFEPPQDALDTITDTVLLTLQSSFHVDNSDLGNPITEIGTVALTEQSETFLLPLIPTNIVAPGVGVTTFTGLETGTTYTADIRARNAVGLSVPATDAGTASIPPNAPIISTCTNGRNKTIIFNWSNPTGLNTGGVPLTRYRVQWEDQISGDIQTREYNTVPPTTKTETAALYNRDYVLRVAVGNDRGFGPYSADSNIVNTTTTLPNAPTIGTATRGDRQATITFTPSTSDGGADIIRYIAESTPGGITATRNLPGPSSITVSGLTNGTSYTFVVQAETGFGTGPASSSSNSVIPATVPGAPSITSAVRTSSTSATITYTAPTSDGGRPITSYTAVSNPGNFTASVSRATGGTILVSGLTSGAFYTFTVFATNEVGNSSNSNVSSSVPIGNAPTANPTFYSAYAYRNATTVTTTELSAALGSLTSAQRGGWPESNVTYEIEIQEDATNIITLTIPLNSSNTRYYGYRSASGDTPFEFASVGDTVRFRVRVTNPNGSTSFSSWVFSQVVRIHGEILYNSGRNDRTDTFTFTAPPTVTRVSVVCVGGGGGGATYAAGGGGGLGYKNNITVIPGIDYTVQTGKAGTGFDPGIERDGFPGDDSWFSSSALVRGGGGGAGLGSNSSAPRTAGAGGSFTGDGGGNGGEGGLPGGTSRGEGGGGGAGGYSGNGGRGASSTDPAISATVGSGGGGAGGSINDRGGGVGTHGAGIKGYSGHTFANGESGSIGPAYGNGARSWSTGVQGAVRIIWPGDSRSFGNPSTFSTDTLNASRTPADPYIDPYVVAGSSTSLTVNWQLATEAGRSPPFEIVFRLESEFGIVTEKTFLLSPIGKSTGTEILTGLTAGTGYRISAALRNSYGQGPFSSQTAYFTPGAVGEQIFTNTSDVNDAIYEWTVPVGVTAVNVICVGGGGGGSGTSAGAAGGGGGGLGYRNNILVTQWNREIIQVGKRGTGFSPGVQRDGRPGGDSFFRNTGTVVGYGGEPGIGATAGLGGGFNPSGGSGGAGGTGDGTSSGGGGAGGYSGNGGQGRVLTVDDSGNITIFPASGAALNSGGGAGGGLSTPGGGVGIYGQGPDGRFAATNITNSKGENGSVPSGSGVYGAGAGAWANNTDNGRGVVRIVWNGAFTTQFPSRNTGEYLRDSVPGLPSVGKPYSASNTSVVLPYGSPKRVGGSGITDFIFRAVGGGNTIEKTLNVVLTHHGNYTFTGLTANISYSFSVAAVNSFGTGPFQSYPFTVTPGLRGEITLLADRFNTVNTVWAAPPGVQSVSVVCVGGGGGGSWNAGGGGGGLTYRNNYAVDQYQEYDVQIGGYGAGGGRDRSGDPGGDSWFVSSALSRAGGGGAGIGSSRVFPNTGGGGGAGAGISGTGGGSGGTGGDGGPSRDVLGGGGGAGGYSGAGGRAAGIGQTATGGLGGAGGGGNLDQTGGGVGILGEGTSGGIGQSGSVDAGNTAYGAGGGAWTGGGGGAVRIIYPGASRSFPNTDTGTS